MRIAFETEKLLLKSLHVCYPVLEYVSLCTYILQGCTYSIKHILDLIIDILLILFQVLLILYFNPLNGQLIISLIRSTVSLSRPTVSLIRPTISLIRQSYCMFTLLFTTPLILGPINIGVTAIACLLLLFLETQQVYQPLVLLGVPLFLCLIYLTL